MAVSYSGVLSIHSTTISPGGRALRRTEHGAQANERDTRSDDERHQPFLDWYPRDVCDDHDGPPAVAKG
jgi:hypothetical protein